MAQATRKIDNRTTRREFREIRALIVYHQAPADSEPRNRERITSKPKQANR